MKKVIFILTTIFLLLAPAACNNKKLMKEKPKNLISYDSMVVFLADEYIIESSLFFAPRSYDNAILSRYAYQEFFEKHKITREQYLASIDYYLSNEDVARELLTAASKLVADREAALPPDTTPQPEETEILNNY